MYIYIYVYLYMSIYIYFYILYIIYIYIYKIIMSELNSNFIICSGTTDTRLRLIDVIEGFASNWQLHKYNNGVG